MTALDPQNPKQGWLTWTWRAAHVQVWVIATWIVLWASQATAPYPLWHWEAARLPFIKVEGREIALTHLVAPGQTIKLTPHWHGLPPHVQPTLADKKSFEASEMQLIGWTGQALAWVDEEGRRWPISWQAAGLRGIPTISWTLLLASILSWHVALWNLRRNIKDTTTRLYVAAGIGFTTGNLIRAWLCARPWGLPEFAWDFQFIVSHTCGLVFLGGLLLMVLRIPTPVVSRRQQLLIAGLIASIEVADATHFVPNQLMATYQWPMAGLAIAVIVAQCYMAWKGRHDASYAAALRWIFLVFTMAVVPPVALYAAWATGLIETHLYDPVLIAPTLGYFAMSALLHRERLLRLESWRARATSWWITCLLALGLMVTLLVRGDEWMGWALGVTALSLPWIYLTVRAVLTYRTPPTAPERLQTLMPDVMSLTVSQATREALADQWLSLLYKAFSPMSVAKPFNMQPDKAWSSQHSTQISADGMTLLVPDLMGGLLSLSRRSPGSSEQTHGQPYTPTDAELAEALWRLTSHGLLTKDSYAAGVNQERKRIAADLHDSIGGRLLHLSHTAANQHQRQYAINTLADLRNITRGLSRSASTWEQVLADLRHQTQRELDAVGVDLRWACDWTAEQSNSAAEGEEAVALHCVTSELVRNALQHAQPKQVQVRWTHQGPDVKVLIVKHDGHFEPPAQWQPGLGLNSIRRRFADRQGGCQWEQDGADLIFKAWWC